MSDEAENAATAQLHSRFKKANEARAKLHSKLVSVGEHLAGFSVALRSPKGYRFDVTNNLITVGERGRIGDRPLAHINPSDLNWEEICETLRGYLKATEDREESARLLRESGIPVAED